MKRSATVFAALVALVLILPLAGCSVIAPLVKSAGESSAAANAKPTVGQCWEASSAQVDGDASWYGPPAVKCSTSHQSYTVSVVSLSKKLPATWSTAEGDVRKSVDDAAWNKCFSAGFDAIGTLGELENRFVFSYFLPTEIAWLNGARWARCDVALYKVGSLLSAPKLTDLPANFQNLVISVNTHPDKYEVCLDTEEPVTDVSDPYASVTARYASCSGSPQWRERWVKDLPGAEWSPFPSDEVLGNFAQQTCGDPADELGLSWLSYPPTGDSWKAGDRAVECWVSDEVSPTT